MFYNTQHGRHYRFDETNCTKQMEQDFEMTTSKEASADDLASDGTSP